ncbi:hypothetical protein WJX84_000878 [Apatococcus fuscideae]|uniref:Uncharacterized protein n=1 Tax=Apatococcus fuscideae TaxID=2026836 RepID=A0AAW1SN64_9CHLO
MVQPAKSQLDLQASVQVKPGQRGLVAGLETIGVAICVVLAETDMEYIPWRPELLKLPADIIKIAKYRGCSSKSLSRSKVSQAASGDAFDAAREDLKHRTLQELSTEAELCAAQRQMKVRPARLQALEPEGSAVSSLLLCCAFVVMSVAPCLLAQWSSLN